MKSKSNLPRAIPSRKQTLLSNRWDLIIYLILALVYLILAIMNPRYFGGKWIMFTLIGVIIIGTIAIWFSHKKIKNN